MSIVENHIFIPVISPFLLPILNFTNFLLFYYNSSEFPAYNLSTVYYRQNETVIENCYVKI